MKTGYYQMTPSEPVTSESREMLVNIVFLICFAARVRLYYSRVSSKQKEIKFAYGIRELNLECLQIHKSSKIMKLYPTK